MPPLSYVGIFINVLFEVEQIFQVLDIKYGKVMYLGLMPEFSHLKLAMKQVTSLPRVCLQKTDRGAAPEDLPPHSSQAPISGLEKSSPVLPVSLH